MLNNIRISPSRFEAMMTKGRGKEEFGATFESLAEEIAMEVMEVEKENVTTREMQWGIDNEPFAIAAYEERAGRPVTPVLERLVHPDYSYVTGEPDGLIGADGLIEAKCPNSSNHMKNLRTGEQVKKYLYQMQGYMWITGRTWCDFVSYDPRFPEAHRLFIQTVDRDDEIIAEIERRAQVLYNRVQQILTEING